MRRLSKEGENIAIVGRCVRYGDLAQMLRVLLALLLLTTTAMAQQVPTEDYSAYRTHLQYFETGEGKMAYLDKGGGPIILLIHGVPTSSWVYAKLTNELVAKGYRVVAPDLLGYGASDKPKDPAMYDQQEQGQRILALMDYLGIEHWTHVCHDVGGLWSWEMLPMQSEFVQRLVILNTIIQNDGFKPPMRFKEGWWARFYTNMYKWKLTSKPMVKATMKNGLSKNTKLSKERLKGYVIPMQEGGNTALYHFFTQTCTMEPNYAPSILSYFEKPTLVIWGAQDPMLKWEPQKEMVMESLNIPEESIIILTESAHFVQEEEPKRIANLIADFVGDD